MLVATHSGPFHCDDVFACALLRVFVDPQLEVLRTRDLTRIAAADVAIDVGGEYDPARGRFDHHQREYVGPLSSAGMVLAWLSEEGKVSVSLGDKLRTQWVDYIDAVDNGACEPNEGVPCLPTVISALCEQAESFAEFDVRYAEAVQFCVQVIEGLRRAEQKTEAARAAVVSAMAKAVADGTRILVFDRHYKWKRTYFEHGGADHPTDYALFPDGDSWRILAIPPEHESFENKRSLPEAWAGLVDDALSEVIGVEGARFCHKNRFIAVFATRAAAEAAIDKWGLASRG